MVRQEKEKNQTFKPACFSRRTGRLTVLSPPIKAIFVITIYTITTFIKVIVHLCINELFNNTTMVIIIKVIDLFCGCGGFSEGFRQAGHEIILAVDSWETALKSHELNHPECEHWLTDVGYVNDLPECDIIIGSPPCQNFSSLNTKKNVCNGLELVHEFERIVKINQPKYWIWENVEYVKRFYPSASIINSWDYGLGQRRKRAFVSNFSISRMNYKSGYWTQPLGYDGHLAEANGKAAWAHRCSSGTVRTKRIRDLNTNKFLSMDEVKHLMGFPPSYKLCGGVSLQQKQLGNAVCPPISKEFGECLLQELNNEKI